ncbi:MAG TPA: transglycosylase SLT domain-containing protein [Pyrinomonadaceae bacterium]|nr:transglycosylase SLT domain-containing protein [Pyrinomonadaceae bacterium]
MNINFRKHRLILIITGLVVVVGLSLSPFLSASCSTHQGSQGESKALETLRNMTRGGTLPAEDAVSRIETAHPDTKTAALARIIRARIRMKAGDYAGAASLLEAKVITSRAGIADYALLLRGKALEQAGRRTEARAAYEQLARDYPTSLQARQAALRNAQMLIEDGQAAAAPVLLKDLNEKNDPAALLLSAKAYEQTNEQTQALGMYRRIYFFAPSSQESAEAASAITRLGSTPSPASAEEALSRADRLFEARKNADAAAAYADAFSRFPSAATAQAQLRRGIAATNAKRTTDAVSALTSVPAGAGEQKAEALYYLSQAYAQARQWDAARGAIDELRRSFPQSAFTPRAITNAGVIARDAKSTGEALNLFRQAVAAYPERAEVAQAQFEIAWAAHDAKNYQESSRLLIEHLAIYADKNTDNRGRAGYWAARDAERAGKLAEARAIYEAMQARYDANWYGYLSKQRLETINRNNAPRGNFAPDSIIGRAVANLQTVTVADESAGQAEMERIARADEFSIVGTDDLALEELEIAQGAAPASPRVNLAVARIYRSREDNLRAFVELRKSYPDYSQMKPEELTREEWEIFYPLAFWDIIVQEARARRLDPHQVAGLIRQESVFNPRARSNAKAYGLMQLLVPTGAAMARRNGISETITEQSLYQPRLNIQLGTSYMREQFDKFGRIEYVAVAYNAGPGRVPQWRSTLPLEMDEFAEAIPFKETRGYVQGVVRNTLQYERLYDDNGQFRAEVGSSAINPQASGSASAQSANPMVRKRRVTGDEKEE